MYPPRSVPKPKSKQARRIQAGEPRAGLIAGEPGTAIPRSGHASDYANTSKSSADADLGTRTVTTARNSLAAGMSADEAFAAIAGSDLGDEIRRQKAWPNQYLRRIIAAVATEPASNRSHISLEKLESIEGVTS